MRIFHRLPIDTGFVEIFSIFASIAPEIQLFTKLRLILINTLQNLKVNFIFSVHLPYLNMVLNRSDDNKILVSDHHNRESSHFGDWGG